MCVLIFLWDYHHIRINTHTVTDTKIAPEFCCYGCRLLHIFQANYCCITASKCKRRPRSKKKRTDAEFVSHGNVLMQFNADCMFCVFVYADIYFSTSTDTKKKSMGVQFSIHRQFTTQISLIYKAITETQTRTNAKPYSSRVRNGRY